MVPVPVHPAWPTTGNIEFRHYTTNLLHNVSLNIQSGETISIIGADKHTFAQSLFQLERTPPLSGSIHVDGVDITHLDVYHLRSRVAWVGSEDENAFFSGTIRENLASRLLWYQYGVELLLIHHCRIRSDIVVILHYGMHWHLYDWRPKADGMHPLKSSISHLVRNM